MDSAPKHPGVRFPPPLLFVAGLVAAWALGRRWPLPLAGDEAGGALTAAGAGLVALGVALAAWGVVTFRRARTGIYPRTPATAVVEAGPYRFTRNPMYVGMTLGYLGGALAMNSAWPLVLLPAVLVVLYGAVVRREERYLASAFGPAYEDYRRRVRRWL
jgi:protein-S-isoprenylcysteine O-methyltransferase Ste14